MSETNICKEFSRTGSENTHIQFATICKCLAVGKKIDSLWGFGIGRCDEVKFYPVGMMCGNCVSSLAYFVQSAEDLNDEDKLNVVERVRIPQEWLEPIVKKYNQSLVKRGLNKHIRRLVVRVPTDPRKMPFETAFSLNWVCS